LRRHCRAGATSLEAHVFRLRLINHPGPAVGARDAVPDLRCCLMACHFGLRFGPEHDLKGIVAKWKRGRYHSDGQTTSWLKLRNPTPARSVEPLVPLPARRHAEATP
jgi:hypothetical protein